MVVCIPRLQEPRMDLVSRRAHHILLVPVVPVVLNSCFVLLRTAESDLAPKRHFYFCNCRHCPQSSSSGVRTGTKAIKPNIFLPAHFLRKMSKHTNRSKLYYSIKVVTSSLVGIDQSGYFLNRRHYLLVTKSTS
jgi:hypothetical protein